MIRLVLIKRSHKTPSSSSDTSNEKAPLPSSLLNGDDLTPASKFGQPPVREITLYELLPLLLCNPILLFVRPQQQQQYVFPQYLYSNFSSYDDVVSQPKRCEGFLEPSLMMIIICVSTTIAKQRIKFTYLCQLDKKSLTLGIKIVA